MTPAPPARGSTGGTGNTGSTAGRTMGNGGGRSAPGVARGFVRYAAVGALATVVHYAVLALAVEGLGWPAWLGSGAGATVGAQVAYFGNRHYTFDHGGALAASWFRFQLTALAGALQGMAIVALGVRAGWHYLAAQLAATLAGLVVTYAVNRWWTFR